MNTSTPHLGEAVFVAGPNGSGKSTAVDGYIRQRFSELPYLNADNLVRSWRQSGAQEESDESVGQRAASEIDRQVMEAAERGQSFVVETVLSSGKYRRVVETARAAGLIFRLVYVTTLDPELNVQRVQQRVASGGHDVPEDRIRSRWGKSMSELPWFAARADRLLVVDNSGDLPVPLALRQLGSRLAFTGQKPEHPALTRLAGLENTPALPL